MREARDMYARACELNTTNPWIKKYGHHFQNAEDVGRINGGFAAGEARLVEGKDVLDEALLVRREQWHACENNLLSNIAEAMQQGRTMARIGSLTVIRLGTIKVQVDDDRYACLASDSVAASARPSPTSQSDFNLRVYQALSY
jgi:hypothetical protein